MDATIAIIVAVVWLTEWGTASTHVHRNDRAWTRVHLFDLLAGKVRYLGTSNENAYGLTKANTVADYEGLARFESIQNNFSLLNN